MDELSTLVIKHQPKVWPQIVASLIATLSTFCSGTVLGWTSTANPQLKERKEIGELTDSELSWIASIAVVGALISGFAAGFSISKIGRRWTLIFLVIPFALGWLLVAFSANLGMMLAGRFITGFCCGAGTLIVPVYISEVTQDRFRGPLTSFMMVSLTSGILFSYVLGAFVTWHWLSLVSGMIPILLAVGMLLMPESPGYLVSKGKRAEAGKSLRWLRGAQTVNEVEDELKELTRLADEDSKVVRGSIGEMFVPKTMKPVGICLLLMLFQQFGGINAVIFFAGDIFSSSGSDLDPNVASIIIGVIQVLAVIVSTLLVDRIGRKVQMFISHTGMTFSITALGLFFYLKNSSSSGQSPEGLGWLPISSLILYIITYNLGSSSLPWSFMAELCPNHVKGPASALVTSTCWCMAFIITFTFADLRNLMGEQFVFWIYGGFCAAGALFCLLILPETRGKSLAEIQNMF